MNVPLLQDVRCETCVYRFEYECRRSPPTMGPPGYRGVFPIISPLRDWCGEHTMKIEPTWPLVKQQ